MLDDLEVHHHVDGGVGYRQRSQIGGDDLHPGVAGPYVRNGAGVVIDRHHPAGHRRDQVGAIALPAARLEYVATCADVDTPEVGDLMAAEPIILHRQAGNGPLAGQG